MQQSFSDLGVPTRITRALAERDIHTPFPIQEQVLRHALAGRDILAKAPTGSGKTLGFAIPIVERLEASERGPVALVLVPTRELASQVAGEIEAIAPQGISVATVYGGVPIHAQAKRARNAHVLVATPGRLNDLLERKAITLDASVGELARMYTTDPVRCEAAPLDTEAGGEVEHRFVSVRADDKVETLAELLRGDRGLALVFVRTRRGADRLVKKLAFHQVDAVALHGDLSQGQRELALRRFESGQATTLVATDVAARGLDLVDITHVINFDPPAEHSGYLHRVGRTGRAGRSGVGVTFVLPE